MCLLGQANCSQICDSYSNGTYACRCQQNFVLQSDGKSCNASTSCSANSICSYLCAVDQLGSEQCSCPDTTGWVLASDGKSCLLVDMCTTSTPCVGSYRCTTQNKSPYFTCTCTNGYKLAPDGVTCLDRDGAWSDWSDWSACSATCSGGIQYRYRTCTNPTPARYGLDCTGDSNVTRACNSLQCPGMYVCTFMQRLLDEFHFDPHLQ